MTTAEAARVESVERVSVRETTVPGSFVDGAWWPRSSDLTVELPPLLRRLSPASTADVRVAYHLGTWKRAPRKFFLGQRMIRLGGFVHQDPLVLSLSGAVGNRRLDLLVVDPTTPPDVARRALLLAGAPDCALGPSEILARAVDEAAKDRPVNAAG